MLVMAYKGVVSDVAGIATTQLASALTFHVATIDAIDPVGDADIAQENIELEQRHKATLKMISDKKQMSAIASSTSKNPDALPASHRMMSLVGATPDSAFNMCTSDYLTGQFLAVKVNPGCISLFNNDVSSSHTSKVITFCGCENIGPKKYDFVSLQKASLIGKRGNGLISFIATGPDASVTLYNSANFDSELKDVIGPNTQVSLSRVAMGESNWDNAVYSLVMQSWSSCDLAPVVCAPETTQSPVTLPTPSPFIQPTALPTKRPIIEPTPAPSLEPTPSHTLRPRARPTMEPLAVPTMYPTMDPTKAPVPQKSRKPTRAPLAEPSHPPTEMPVLRDPTLMPTLSPTMDPRIVICKGKLAKDSKIVPGRTYPSPGCASFFWRDVGELDNSYISTMCTCGEVGNMVVPNDLMAKIGAARNDGFPTISSVITGYNTSLTLYTSSDLTGSDKYVMGPQEIADLTKIQRKSAAGSWNDQVKSMNIMAWNECTQHLYTDSCFDF